MRKFESKVVKQKRHEVLQIKNESFLLHSKSASIEQANSVHQEDMTLWLSSSSDAEVHCNLSEEDLKKKIVMLDYEVRMRNKEIYKLREENAKSTHRIFGFHRIKKSNGKIKFFTGIPTLAIFLWVLKLVKNIRKICCTLSIEDHLLIVSMKLRIGLMNRDIAYRFGYSPAIISKIFRQWLPEVSARLKNLIVWPTRAELRTNLPQSFRQNYRDCVCIIDCSEIFIEIPKNLTARAQAWFNYKHSNTIKYLIGIIPAGAGICLPEDRGGRVSDKQTTLESGFLSKIDAGDWVLADRGFLIEEDLNRRRAYMSMPKFTKGKDQLSAADVHKSRQIANVRINHERVIGQVEKFRILQATIPITQVDLIDHMMIVVSVVLNSNKRVVPN